MTDESTEEKREKAKDITGEVSIDPNEVDTSDFVVYNMPVPLIQKYISYAKLYYDNEVWKVLAKAMELLVEEQTTWRDSVEYRLGDLEMKVESMMMRSESAVDKNTEAPTFGEDETDVDKLNEMQDGGE